ncbi:MAG: ferritin-like domain-containing protein [Deltaproteobacteria bacterium]|nr:ferritin-like domain-containing protein [Deltaproteobacteria bacterium]
MNRDRLLSLVFRHAIALLAAQTVACGGCGEEAETVTIPSTTRVDLDDAKDETTFAYVDPQTTIDERCKDVCRLQKGSSYTLESCIVLESDASSSEPSQTQCTFSHWVCSGMRSSGHCGMGRPPAGYVASERGGSLGDFFAHAAELEAASITAFRHLELDLLAWGAPTALVDRVRAARRDEVVHARMMRDLARAHGKRPRRAHRVTRHERPLVDIAIENAVEGCVNETYSALVATWSATHAVDPTIACAMARIADDETRHAELAWAIDAWLSTKLSACDRARVEAALSSAAEALVVAVGSRAASRPVLDARVEPTSSEARALARAVAAELWPTARVA